ncbi:2-C-methyl-D-erythritol 4-phosphate cytidylyltransferase [Lihuaxuella thermophila]|uniref:2-C-methyl-D-erythritol 4-phosphate cytidylyltransferase n=1 Tax=Lihuaxuella thermophila TaxID=1173111 RepID=A0A1H8HUS6_9BACL|nr:2-C-methyl-D-erythritol 4-phosphate cytidylyltransferase [Lihuaxuella thermophila]SEN59837.1 2-C-methyl-D-erythritol 4-phosphate cytidylyltransferase [Lihuaxuella thermophila]
MSVGVIIPAAGQGKRMGTKESKQFLFLDDQPVLLHTLRVFETHPEVGEIVVVTRENEIGRVTGLVEKAGLKKVTKVTVGGRERQESVYQGLKWLTAEWVLVHDAVRPFVSHEAISRLLTVVRMHGAAILAVPVKDTVKQVDSAGIVEMTPDRNRLWAVQTPQAFRTDLLREAHEQAAGQERTVTDDSMLVELLGIDVRVVEGEYTNIKLTTPDDLILAEAIYQMRRNKA